MNWRRFGAGVVAAGTLAGGGTVAVDANINPYEVSAEKYELASESTIAAAGENKVEAHRDRPAVTLSKWNGEAGMTVAYNDIRAEGSRQFLTNRVEWKTDKEEVHAYPLPANEGMEDGGFEIEIVLDEAPDTNVFEFQIEGAEDLDFFYQPELSAQEIAEGAFRPDNVIGSYAVYHKSKANHRIGDTNYATGKAYHIYRPKAFAADGAETWAELVYADGVLSVTVPQEWLAKAAYPVRVDPTFGYTSIGASNTSFNGNIIWGFMKVSIEDGTGVSISAYERDNSSGFTQKANITETDSGVSYLASAQTNVVNGDGTNTPSWRTFTFTSAPTFAAATYRLLLWHNTQGANNMFYYYDTNVETASIRFRTSATYGASWPSIPSWSGSVNNQNVSIYATYTASGGGGGATAAPEDVIIFE